VPQRAKVGGPHAMHDGENSADLLGSAVAGLIGAHDTLQLIRILALLQLINT
jgi:hypothetical protein